MTWVYITLDVFLVALMVFLAYILVRFWTKNRGLHVSPLSKFRNDDLYEQSLEEKRRLAHIEDRIAEEKFLDEVPDEDEKNVRITDDNITFSDGYGNNSESEEDYDEN